VTPKLSCLVLGAGRAGRAHLEVLRELMPGRYAAWSRSGARQDAARTLGAPFFCGALEGALENFRPTHVIVATPVQTLAELTKSCLRAGVRNILVEKPGALTVRELEEVSALSARVNATVGVAFNRRWYGSVLQARSLMQARGETVTRVTVDFSERTEGLEQRADVSSEVKARLVVANSLHALDMAFLPSGLPDDGRSRFRRAGSLPWHLCGSSFEGAGLTEKGVPFSYVSDWNERARWLVEWQTASLQLRFQPLERVSVKARGDTRWEDVAPDDLDLRFKPGFFRQGQAFLEGSPLAGLEEAARLVGIAQKIAGYPAE
jgi:predicted dehydrogenase